MFCTVFIYYFPFLTQLPLHNNKECALAHSRACGGRLRHLPYPPQCASSRSVFYFTGKQFPVKQKNLILHHRSMRFQFISLFSFQSNTSIQVLYLSCRIKYLHSPVGLFPPLYPMPPSSAPATNATNASGTSTYFPSTRNHAPIFFSRPVFTASSANSLSATQKNMIAASIAPSGQT